MVFKEITDRANEEMFGSFGMDPFQPGQEEVQAGYHGPDK